MAKRIKTWDNSLPVHLVLFKMTEELWSLSMVNDVDAILGNSNETNSYFDGNILAALDTSVSPVDLLGDGLDNYFWDCQNNSSPVSSPTSSDSDYSSLCSSPTIKCEDQVKSIRDVKPSGINKRTRKPKETKPKISVQSTFDGNSSLFFSRAELLKMTVDELEQRVSAVEAIRKLTEKEKKEVKKQRRMIKNRESAMASRIRKKQLVENMEEAMAKIKEENESLKKRVNDLEKENFELKSRLNEPFWSIGSLAGPARIATQTSTSLFIILLSFGLLFAQIQPQDNTFPQFSSVFPSYEAQQVLGSGHVITYGAAASKPVSVGNTNLPTTGIQNRALLMHGDKLEENLNLVPMEIEVLTEFSDESTTIDLSIHSVDGVEITTPILSNSNPTNATSTLLNESNDEQIIKEIPICSTTNTAIPCDS